jgi:hypothetical protein
MMEREQELKKLINVLNRTIRTAMRVQWMNVGESETRFAVAQYNKILARLSEIDPPISALFAPLPEDATLTTVAMACRQIVSYYEDEVRPEREFGWGFEGGPFRGFGAGKPFDLEEFGNAVRDFVQEWQRRERERRSEKRRCG